MTEDELALAVMDDDGFGCAITTSLAERQRELSKLQPPFLVPVLRDEDGYPVKHEVTRDRDGRFCRTRYEYVWVV